MSNPKRTTQADVILSTLMDHGGWVDTLTLRRTASADNIKARVSELREQGHDIQSRPTAHSDWYEYKWCGQQTANPVDAGFDIRIYADGTWKVHGLKKTAGNPCQEAMFQSLTNMVSDFVAEYYSEWQDS